MGNALSVKLDGEYLDTLGLGYSDPVYSGSYGSPGGGGCEEATTTLSAPFGYRHQILREGVDMEVLLGSHPVWTGVVDSIDRDTWEIHGRGIAKMATNIAALDATGNPTTVADTAIDAAVFTRGLLVGRWYRPTSISNTPYGANTETDAPNTLATLLDAVAAAQGKWWTVWADRSIRLEPLPTVPTFHMLPKSVDLPVSYEEYASNIVLRYYDSTTHVAQTVTASDPVAEAAYPKEYVTDALALGEITAAEATGYAQGIIDQGKARPGYAASVEVTPWQLLNDNFGPVDPS
jgi:hypothetical protein